MKKLNIHLTATAVLIGTLTYGMAADRDATTELVAKSDPFLQDVRVVCDQYGSCWDAGPGYGYEYRPPSKWERKGFCPPGQAKKGNC